MKKVFDIQANSFILFVEYAAPILILGSIFLLIFSDDFFFELKDFLLCSLVVFLAVLRGVYILINKKCSVTITDDSLTIFNKNTKPVILKFEDISTITYLYYGCYSVTYKNGKEEKVKIYNKILLPEKKYIEINVILQKVLQDKFNSHYTEDLILYSKDNKYPVGLEKYDKNLLSKRIVATILYSLFSIPIILLYLINLLVIILFRI